MAAALVRLITAATAAAVVLGHAVVETPTPRRAGSSYTQRCGNVYADFMETDLAGPIENGVQKVAGSEIGCNPYLCCGYQYEDNTAKNTNQAKSSTST